MVLERKAGTPTVPSTAHADLRFYRARPLPEDQERALEAFPHLQEQACLGLISNSSARHGQVSRTTAAARRRAPGSELDHVGQQPTAGMRRPLAGRWRRPHRRSLQRHLAAGERTAAGRAPASAASPTPTWTLQAIVFTILPAE